MNKSFIIIMGTFSCRRNTLQALTELFSGSNYDRRVTDTMKLPAWGYKILVS